MKINGSKVLIAGGTRRIGLSLSQAFIAHGATVTATYRTKPQTAPSGLRLLPMDLDNETSITAATNTLLRDFGTPEIIVLSASTFFPRTLENTSLIDWERLHTSNVKGHFFLLQKLLPAMKKGIVIAITDIHATVPLRNFTAYVAQKASLRMMIKNLAFEFAPQIRLCSISPGSILFPEDFTANQKAAHLAKCPLAREGEPDDLFQAARFLIENDYITGFDLKVDGGTSLSSA